MENYNTEQGASQSEVSKLLDGPIGEGCTEQEAQQPKELKTLEDLKEFTIPLLNEGQFTADDVCYIFTKLKFDRETILDYFLFLSRRGYVHILDDLFPFFPDAISIFIELMQKIGAIRWSALENFLFALDLNDGVVQKAIVDYLNYVFPLNKNLVVPEKIRMVWRRAVIIQMFADNEVKK